MTRRRARRPPRAAARPAGAWTPPRRRLALALVLAAGLLTVLLRFEPWFSTNGDDAQYAVLAKSLLAGKGMKHINDPREPPHDKYPPLYPLLLCIPSALAPALVWPLKIPSILSALAALWAFFRWVETRDGPGLALTAGLLTALCGEFIVFGQLVMAEMTFTALSLFALVRLDALARAASPPAPGGRAMLASLALVAACYYVRTAGIALAGGAILLFLLRGWRRQALYFGGGFALAVLPWFLRNRMLGTPGTYLKQLVLVNPYNEELGTVGAGDVAARVLENAKIYVVEVMPRLLFPALNGPLRDSLDGRLLAGLLLTLLALAGFVTRWRRGPAVAETYVAAYVTMCLFWPSVWSSTRFLLPVAPFLFLHLLEGGRAALGWSGRLLPGAGRPAVAAACAAGLLALQAAGGAEAARAPRGNTPDWASYYAAADWMRANTPPESVAVCRSAFLFYFRSQRKTVGYPFSTNPDEVIATIGELGATHVVVDSFRWTNTTVRYLIPALERHPERFEPLHVTASPPTYVLRVRGPEERTGEGG